MGYEVLSSTVKAIQLMNPGVEMVEIYSTPAGARLYEMLVEGDSQEASAIINIIGRKRQRILDIACGGGRRLTLPLLLAGHQVIAADNSSAMLEELSTCLADLPKQFQESCSVELADVCNLLTWTSQFDSVVLGATTISLFSPIQRMKIFENVRNILKREGSFFVSVPDWEDSSQSMYSVENIKITPVKGMGLVSIIETSDASIMRREVVVIPHTKEFQSQPIIFYNLPHLVFRKEIELQLIESGFNVVSETLLGEAGPHKHWLLECEIEKWV